MILSPPLADMNATFDESACVAPKRTAAPRRLACLHVLRSTATACQLVGGCCLPSCRIYNMYVAK